MRKVLELNGKTEILSIPNISMKPKNNIIFLNIQNRLSVSFITCLFSGTCILQINSKDNRATFFKGVLIKRLNVSTPS